jgi:hypothetical protein
VSVPQFAFLAFTEITDPRQHKSYNAWHQLDHLPEQLPLDGVLHGQRWVASPQCKIARAAESPHLSNTHYLTAYLMGDPIRDTLTAFAGLADRLRSMGRFHGYRRILLSGAFRLLDVQAAERVMVSANAVLYRPNRGVYAVVEKVPDHGHGGTAPDASRRGKNKQQMAGLLDVPGVAGVAVFVTEPDAANAGGKPGTRHISLLHLDDDPVAVARALRPLFEERWRDGAVEPEFAGPFETIIPWQWNWFDSPENTSVNPSAAQR